MIALLFLLGAILFSPLPLWAKAAAAVLFPLLALRRRP